MSRIRTIKPTFWTSEQVMDCSRDARLLFIGLWNFADDAGRLTYNAKQIKALVFPGDEDPIAAVETWLAELVSVGLIVPYMVGDRRYLEITGWKHQKIDKPQPSKHPPRPVADHSANVRGTVSTERKGEEGNGRDRDTSSPSLRSGEDAARALSPVAELRVAITREYERVAQCASPDTSRAGMWLNQGYPAGLILSVIETHLAAGKRPSSLAYFDPIIREAQANRSTAPPTAEPQGLSPEEARRKWAARHAPEQLAS